MRSLLQDLRYGARILLKKPGFTLIAVLTLALGIGANTAIFSVVNAVLLRPLPFPNDAQLVVVQQTQLDKPNDNRGVSYLNFTDWQSRNRSFSSLAIVGADETTLTGEGEPLRVRGAVVSADFFKTLGVTPQLGRAFAATDELPGADSGFGSVMLTDSGWRNRFGGDPKIVGRKIMLGEQSFTVIGVSPRGVFPLEKEPIDYWTTVVVNGDPAKAGSANASRGYRPYLGVIARLKPNVPLAQARAELETIHRDLQEKHRAANGKTGVMLTPLRDLVVGDARSSLWLLFGIVGAVLLIACVNVANLLLTATVTRRREMAIRAAMGAGTRHIIRQLLGESLLLSLTGGLAGLLLSMWLIEILLALSPADIPRISGLEPDWRVLLFTFGAAILTGVLCGLAPAFTALKINLTDAVKQVGQGANSGPGVNLLRNGLVVGQITVALVLLTGAGLLTKSLLRLHQVKPGFETGNILTMQMSLAGDRYFGSGMKPERINAFLDELTDRIRRLPGVTDVSLAQCVPLTSVDNNTSFDIVERPSAKGEQPNAQLRFIGLNYFQTLNIPTLEGRDFTARDNPHAPPVMIVNEAFAREYFRGENPIGKRLRLGWGGDEPKEIVGLAGNVRHRGLSDVARPEMYVPQAQFANADLTLLVRSALKPETMVAPIKKEIYALDPQLPVTDVKSLAEYRTESLALPRFNTFLLSLFAGLALLLTAIGLYGLMSYSVTQRTNEIGIRLALGAQTSDVLRMILGQGMRLIAVGVLLGVTASLALTRLMATWLFEVGATDPLTFAGVVLLLIGIVLPACWIPARRATQVDPMVALRRE